MESKRCFFRGSICLYCSLVQFDGCKAVPATHATVPLVSWGDPCGGILRQDADHLSPYNDGSGNLPHIQLKPW